MEKLAPEDRSTAGPFDISEIGVLTPYLDFGSIQLAPRQEMQIRADIDDNTKRVMALTVEIQGHRLQIQAFAATKTDGLWTPTIDALEKSVVDQGGQVERAEGLVGLELRGNVPALVGDNRISRPTRFIGVDGPRWFLRGVISAPTIDDDVYQKLIEVFRSTAVNRGELAMPPGDLLPLRLPVGKES